MGFLSGLFGGGGGSTTTVTTTSNTTNVDVGVGVEVSPTVNVDNIIDLSPIERALMALVKVDETARRELTDVVARQNPLLKALGESLAVGAVVDAATADAEISDRKRERDLMKLGLLLSASALAIGVMGRA